MKLDDIPEMKLVTNFIEGNHDYPVVPQVNGFEDPALAEKAERAEFYRDMEREIETGMELWELEKLQDKYPEHRND